MQRRAGMCARELERQWLAMELTALVVPALKVEERARKPARKAIHGPAQAGKRAQSGLQSAFLAIPTHWEGRPLRVRYRNWATAHSVPIRKVSHVEQQSCH